MENYIVYVPELHYQRVVIEAKSPKQAKQLVKEGAGEYKDNSYKRTLYEDEVQGFDAWRVETYVKQMFVDEVPE